MTEQSQESHRTGKLAQSTLIVMGLFAAAKVVGLFRQRVTGLAFGTSGEFDAYTAAFNAPDLLFTLISGGALAHAFIPVFAKFLTKDDHSEAHRLASGITNTMLLVAIVTAVLLALAAPVVVSAPWGVAPGLNADLQALTTQVLRIVLFSTIIFAVSSLVGGILNAYEHFFLPALAPIIYDLGVIGGLYLFVPKYGIPGLAWGAVFGSILHILVQVPGLIHYKVRWMPTLQWRNPALRRVGVLMLPRIIDLLMARASLQWLNSNIASRLSEGSISALGYAWRIMQMPQTIIGTAIGIVIFPTMSELAARSDSGGQRRALSWSLRAILTLTIPAAVGLILLGKSIIGLLFEGGEFTAESTQITYFALQFYALGVITHSMLEVVVRAFFARQDTVTPLIVSFFTTALNVALALWLVKPLLHGGLALANSIAIGVEALIGLVIVHRRWAGIEGGKTLLAVVKSGVAAAAMGAAIALLNTVFERDLYRIAIGGSVGLLVYLGMAALLKMEELFAMGNIARERIKSLRTAYAE